MSDFILHQLERAQTIEELDLAVPSWRKDEIQRHQVLIDSECSLFIPKSGGLSTEIQFWGDLYLRSLNQVILDVDSALVFSRNRVVSQSGNAGRSARDAAFISGAAARYAKQESSSINSPIAPLGDTWHHYHFLVETLPQVLHIHSKFPKAKFVTSQVMSSVATECFRRIGIEIVRLAKGTLLTSPEVIICDRPKRFYPRKYDLETVKSSVIGKSSEIDNWKKGAVYLSRANAERSPHGESLLEETLTRAGVSVVNLEKFSFQEQVNLVSGFTTVIGFHGAALASMIFLDSGLRVLELSSGDRYESCYRRMAAALQLDYQYVGIEGNARNPNGVITPSNIEHILEQLT